MVSYQVCEHNSNLIDQIHMEKICFPQFTIREKHLVTEEIATVFIIDWHCNVSVFANECEQLHKKFQPYSSQTGTAVSLCLQMSVNI